MTTVIFHDFPGCVGNPASNSNPSIDTSAATSTVTILNTYKIAQRERRRQVTFNEKNNCCELANILF